MSTYSSLEPGTVEPILDDRGGEPFVDVATSAVERGVRLYVGLDAYVYLEPDAARRLAELLTRAAAIDEVTL